MGLIISTKITKICILSPKVFLSIKKVI